MPLLTDIEAAIAEGRAISGLYAKLRTTRGAAERAVVLRKIGECADVLGQWLRQVAEQQHLMVSTEETRTALGRLGEAMEQVMVQEREYRMASGAPPDSQDEVLGNSAR